MPPIPPIAFNISNGLLIFAPTILLGRDFVVTEPVLLYTHIMFSLVFLSFSCKNNVPTPSNWQPCEDAPVDWQGPEGSDFGFRLHLHQDKVYITAPNDCNTPLYQLDDNRLSPLEWNTDECLPRLGQDIVSDEQVWLYAPTKQEWHTGYAPNVLTGRRLTFVEDQAVLLTTNALYHNDQMVSFDHSSVDMARYATDIAVLLRSSPASIWTKKGTYTLNEQDGLFNRIHPFISTANGERQWLLGGGQELVIVNSTAQTNRKITLPTNSRLQTESTKHPLSSIGYSSALGDIDRDGRLDWLVGAPTAGSGTSEEFPEQAGWIGWLEQHNGQWLLQQEWVGAEPFAHLGMSLIIQTSDTRQRVLGGASGTNSVSELFCLENK